MKYPLTVKEVQRVIDLCRLHPLVIEAGGSTKNKHFVLKVVKK